MANFGQRFLVPKQLRPRNSRLSVKMRPILYVDMWPILYEYLRKNEPASFYIGEQTNF
jgi:hypothetical protein